MYARTYGAAALGVDGILIDVEVDVANGLPGFEMVGMPDALVREAKERVRTAIRNSGLAMKQERVTVNLAPAAIRKDSAGLDLPIAVALLAACGIVPAESIQEYAFMGELSLEGACRKVRGVLPMVISAMEHKLKGVFISRDNVNEALLVDGVNAYAVDNLAMVVDFFNGRQLLEPACKDNAADILGECLADGRDFADVQGQFMAKRAFEVAAAGGHNVLLSGSPGAGKTMLARRMGSILPEMTDKEALEVTKIYSISGLLTDSRRLIRTRPFRSPHHTVSSAAMIGGGSIPRPGEVTLSHNGVLFLDELPEFGQKVLESLRQPLEDGNVTVSRVSGTLSFPSRIMLIGAMNPCPCGYYGDKEHPCDCTPSQIKQYTRKLSGPLLDRFDIQIRVPRVSYQELSATGKAESSCSIRQRVAAARKRQQIRYRDIGISCNAQLGHSQLPLYCPMTPEAEMLLEDAFKKRHLSARSYDRIIKVSRTIADLANEDIIQMECIGEALLMRNDVSFSEE